MLSPSRPGRRSISRRCPTVTGLLGTRRRRRHGANVHIVEKGDTLWDLSAKNLQNPYLWPQIWDQNRYILDSHWIYPGDPIVLPAPEVVPEKPAPVAEAAGGGEEGGAEAETEPPPAPPKEYPIGDRHDVYCAPYIQNEPAAASPLIAGAEDEAMGLGQGNIVYVNAGSADGLKPGDKFAILRDRGEVKHPATKEKLGHRIDRMGELTVIAVQEQSATAEITFSCEDINRGDTIVPYKDLPVPLSTKNIKWKIDRYNPNSSGKPSGYVLFPREPQIALAMGNIVAVDLGTIAGVKPGDVMTIYRPNREGADLPRQNLGEGVVLLTDGKSSAVKITASVREIYVGDRVEVR